MGQKLFLLFTTGYVNITWKFQSVYDASDLVSLCKVYLLMLVLLFAKHIFNENIILVIDISKLNYNKTQLCFKQLKWVARWTIINIIVHFDMTSLVLGVILCTSYHELLFFIILFTFAVTIKSCLFYNWTFFFPLID